MAVFRDIDYDLRINGTLTVNGDVTIPSSNLSINGNVTGTKFIGDGSELTNLPIPVATSSPTDGSTNPISSDWAFDHTNSFGRGAHVPNGGTTSQYLRGDGTWQVPPNTNNYVSSVSSTDGGNGTLTLNRSGLSALTLSLAHNHDSQYLKLSGGSLSGDIIHNSNSNTSGFYFTRNGGSLKEHVRVGVDDSIAYFHYNNDETSSRFRFTIENTDTESGGGVNASTHVIEMFGSNLEANISIDGNKVWHEGTFNPANKENTLTFVGSGATSVARSGDTITISSTDLNTWRPIDNTASLGNTANSISSDWAKRHEGTTGNGGHIPSAGTTSQYLRGDGVWGTPPNTNNFVSSVSSTDGGRGTLTLNRSGLSALTINLEHYHDDRYYTEAEVNSLLSGKSDTGHTHPYDNYQSWKIQVNSGATEDISSGEALNITGSGSTSVSRTGNTITISSTDTNTWRGIDDTPVNGETSESISSNWAFNHNAGQGVGKHVPTGGTTSQFLRGDGTWATPVDTNTNNYITGISGGANGNVTITRSGLSNLTWNASHTHDEYLGNGDSQYIGNGFTVKGTMFLGTSGGTYGNLAGNIYIKNSGGSNAIQLSGDGSAKGGSVKAYINQNGDATFDGTATINILRVTNRSQITNLNAEMVGGANEYELGRRQTAYELGGYGVHSGMNVVQDGNGLQTQVQIQSGVAYTKSGKRIDWSGGGYTVSAPSSTTNSHRIDSIYIAGPSEGNNEGKIDHVQGSYSASPTAPSIPSDGILLAHVYMGSNQGTITNDKITDKRLRKPVRYESDYLYIQKGAIDTITTGNTYVDIQKPIRNASSNTTMTFSEGQTSKTWTHNLGLSNYVVVFSSNSPEPHIYWSGKTSNAVTVNLDDVCEGTVSVDVSIVAY